MIIVADTHAHLYPCYNLKQAFRSALDNLERCNGELKFLLGPLAAQEKIMNMVFLTERSNCNFFYELQQSRVGELEPDFKCEALGRTLLTVSSKEQEERLLYLVAGRQVVSQERIEILALNTAEKIKDGYVLEDALRAIVDAGAIPVLNWALGKWSGSRARHVRSLIEKASPEILLLGDVALHPEILGGNAILNAAEEKGYKVIYGSDPLPFAGEEKRIGSFCSYFQSIAPRLSADTDIRQLFLRPEFKPGCLGTPDGLLKSVYRLFRNQLVRRKFEC